MKNEPNQVSKCHGAKMEFETNPGRTVKGGYDLRPVCFVCRQPCEPVPAGDHPIGVNNMVGQPVPAEPGSINEGMLKEAYGAPKGIASCGPLPVPAECGVVMQHTMIGPITCVNKKPCSLHDAEPPLHGIRQCNPCFDGDHAGCSDYRCQCDCGDTMPPRPSCPDTPDCNPGCKGYKRDATVSDVLEREMEIGSEKVPSTSSYGDAIMAEREKHGWRCGKCDGANAPEHSKHCPERADCEFCGKEIPPADEPEGLEEVIDKWFDEKAGRLSVLIDLQNLIKSLLSKERAESDIPACTDHDEIRAKAVREFADGLEREIGEMGFVFDFPPQLLAIEEVLKLIRSKGRPEEENKP